MQAVKVTLAIGPRRERQGASTRASESASASAIGCDERGRSECKCKYSNRRRRRRRSWRWLRHRLSQCAVTLLRIQNKWTNRRERARESECRVRVWGGGRLRNCKCNMLNKQIPHSHTYNATHSYVCVCVCVYIARIDRDRTKRNQLQSWRVEWRQDLALPRLTTWCDPLRTKWTSQGQHRHNS